MVDFEKYCTKYTALTSVMVLEYPNFVDQPKLATT